jgi:pleiotropic regulator 1
MEEINVKNSLEINENEIEQLDNINEFELASAIIPQPRAIKDYIVDSIVSSRNFFLRDINKKPFDDDKNIAFKMKLKLNSEYKDSLKNENFQTNKYSSKLSFRETENKSVSKTGNKKSNQGETQIENFDETGIVKVKDQISKQSNDLLNKIPEKYKIPEGGSGTNTDNLILSIYKNQTHVTFRKNKLVNPEWHPPWKLYRVIAGHTGWVRCIDVDPTNNWFVTGSNDRVIKFWDLASGRLKLSLTGHINTVRAVVVSPRHPYLFSCGEDKQVKCWDLEQNKVVRHYHGHLSGVYCLALHPSLDMIVTGGRDCVARVWDMRSRQQIFCLEGHNNTICSIVAQEYNPQIITGSHDSTIKLWDIRAGKCLSTLTHHKKSIRSLIIHEEEYTFLSGGCDNIKVWKCPEGKFLRNIAGHNAIVNSIALNKDGVLVSGADNGSLFFWDYKSGYNFQQYDTPVQPGSLSSEAGIFDIKFDKSSTRMITAGCDKTIKMWKEDEEATPDTHPINIK